MKIPFGTISVSKKSKELIKKILDSNRLSNGRYVRELEVEFAKLMGVKEAVAVSSGTDADALAMAVLYDFGAKREDEIIVPAVSFVATGNSVLQAGFKPVFVDIERTTLNIDPSRIESAVTKKTRAIMPVHLIGKPAEMDTITGIAKKHNLLVIEDAAEAYGAKYKGRPVGTLGDMGAFSLYVAHVITTIEGGMVITDKKEFAEILRSLRSHGRACKCEKCVLNISSGYCDKRFQHGSQNDIRFITERIGFSSKMNELEAAIGLGNINDYHSIIKKRRQNLDHLMERFDEFKAYMVTIKAEPHEEIGPHAFPVILKEKAPFRRDELTSYLERNGIETRTLYASMPTQCAGFKFLGYRMGDFPEAEYIGRMGFHIGVHQDLNKRHMDYFLSAVRRFLSSHIK